MACVQHIDLKWDHPRSRGVYSQTFKDIFISCGSSPLARGLRVALIGIWMTVVDHPRSRGVYGIITNLQDNPAGSSPLARGLRRDVRKRHRLNRIIPARAGFTSLRSGRMLPPRDHPRSRGVYYSGPERCTRGEGSSPLARGLPWADSTWGCSTGIIPARAGFTTNASESSQGSQDHPRSRGVY